MMARLRINYFKGDRNIKLYVAVALNINVLAVLQLEFLSSASDVQPFLNCILVIWEEICLDILDA